MASSSKAALIIISSVLPEKINDATHSRCSSSSCTCCQVLLILSATNNYYRKYSGKKIARYLMSRQNTIPDFFLFFIYIC